MSKSYLPRYQNSWALVIGVNAYQNVPPLAYACNDAEAVAGVLINELGFPQDHTFLLKDGAATKDTILDLFLSFSQKANDPDDRVLVFYAGHGTTFEGSHGPVGYLVPVNGNLDNKNTLIRWDDLTRNAELIAAKHVLFIMDACYSGLAIQRAIPPGTERFLSDMLQRFSRQVITAGKADETVADGGGPQGKNSIFTGYLLEGLNGAAADVNAVLTANGLMAYVYQKVGQDNRSGQTPHYGHLEGDGDFVLRTPNNEHLSESFESDYLVKTDVEMPEVLSTPEVPVGKPSFSQRNGYADPAYPNFGRNEWSNRLGEDRSFKGTRETSKSFSWLALVLEPTGNYPISIDIESEFAFLSKLKPQSDKPHERFMVPEQGLTTLKSAVLFRELGRGSKLWSHYYRIEDSGNIEYADCEHVFLDLEQIRYFRYVQIVGAIWQFIVFAKDTLSRAGYVSGVRLLVNLIGTRETILADFAEGQGEGGKRWREPFDRSFGAEGVSGWKCYDANIQLEYRFVLQNMNEGESLKIVRDVGNKLGLAYNHRSSPRCFNYGTEVFPWKQYFDGRRW